MERTAIFLCLIAAACGDDSGVSDSGPRRDGGQLDSSIDGPAPDVSDVGADAGADVGNVPDAGPIEMLDPAPPLPDLPADVAQAIAADVAPEFVGVGGAVYTAILTLGDTGQVLYELNPDAALVPASNTKLFTTASALEVLGQDHRFPIQVYASETPVGGEVGELVVVMEHDSSLTSVFYASARDPLERLARDIAAQGITRVRDRVVLRGGGVFAGDSLGGLNVGVERAQIASALGAAMTAAGITAPAPIGEGIADPPAGYALITEAGSRALHVVASHINDVSHNELADELLRHFGYRVGGESSYVGGAREVLAWLASTPVGAGDAAFGDGSGLSLANQVSGRQVADLMRFMRDQPTGAVFERGLSVGGVSGTLRARLTGDDTRGRVFGKTGTLSSVIALSGTLINRHDGRPYDFGLIANGLQRDQRNGVRARFDRVVARLGRNHWGGAAQPSPPTLLSVHALPDRLVVEWEQVTDAERTILWRSADGFVFRREDAVVATGGRAELPLGMPYVRLTAGSGAIESLPSDVYAASPAGSSGRVLLVDAFDRWQRQPAPENLLGRNHDFMVLYAEALDGRPFDMVANEALPDLDLSEYSDVIWVLGEESTEDETIADAEQALLRSYVDGGGRLMVTGAEVAWDLVEMGSATDQEFASGVLNVGYEGDSAETFLLRGAPGGPFADLGVVGFLTPRGVLASFADRLTPGAGASAVLEYEGGLGGIAAVATNAVIVFGFPLESLERMEDRRAILEGWLNP